MPFLCLVLVLLLLTSFLLCLSPSMSHFPYSLVLFPSFSLCVLHHILFCVISFCYSSLPSFFSLLSPSSQPYVLLSFLSCLFLSFLRYFRLLCILSHVSYFPSFLVLVEVFWGGIVRGFFCIFKACLLEMSAIIHINRFYFEMSHLILKLCKICGNLLDESVLQLPWRIMGVGVPWLCITWGSCQKN